MLHVEYEKQPQKFLRRLKDKQLLKRILSRIEELALNPFPRESVKVEGYKEKIFRVRVGNYRILYIIYNEKNTLLISDIDKRERVYD